MSQPNAPYEPSPLHRALPFRSGDRRRRRLSSAIATLCLAAVSIAPAEAERPEIGFATPISVPIGPVVWVTTADGEELVGELRSSTAVYGSTSKLRIRLESGEKVRLKASEIQQVRLPVNDLVRAMMMEEATTTIEKAVKTDYEPIFEATELVFDSVRHPKSRRVLLRQRLNQGYDWRIQVYDLPNSKEGMWVSERGLGWFGDEAKAFLVVKDGAEAVRVRKSDYRDEHFQELFGDCPALLDRYQGKQRKFRLFAEHTYQYHQLCPRPGSTTPVQVELGGGGSVAGR